MRCSISLICVVRTAPWPFGSACAFGAETCGGEFDTCGEELIDGVGAGLVGEGEFGVLLSPSGDSAERVSFGRAVPPVGFGA